jgi:hypothetical protein
MPTLRNYITRQDYATITGDTSEVNDQLIDQAETLIDQACAMFLGSTLQKSMNYEILEENSTTTATTATLSSTYTTNYLKYCTVEVLNGSLAGSKACITSSSTNTITFEQIEGLTGTTAIKIYQTGKFPMVKDVTTGSSVYYKSIPQEIKQAVAWQVKFILENGDLFNSDLMDSENIGGSYSYNRANNSTKSSIIQLLAPQTIQLIKPYTIQTI